MSTEVRLRRGTTAEHATFTGALGEVTVDTDKKTLVVHDGSTPGGTPMNTAVSVQTVALGGTGATNAADARTNLGLGNVDNTSDANKPVSTAQQTALNGKLSLSGGTMTGTILDATFAAASAATKKLGFVLSAITTGVTRNIIMPDRDVDLGKTNWILHSTASLSGAAVEFNSIPAGVRRLRLVIRNGRCGSVQGSIQLGTTSSFENTGYISGAAIARGASATVGYSSSTRFIFGPYSSSTVGFSGVVELDRLDGNEWVATVKGTTNNNGASIDQGVSGGGEKTLSDELTRLRLVGSDDTTAFNAGKVSLFYSYSV